MVAETDLSHHTISARGQQTYLLTEFPAVKSLAPCATGYFWGAQNWVSNDCPTNVAPTFSASCACLKNQNSASIISILSTGILGAYACGTTATQDVTSALAAFSSYCAQAQSITNNIASLPSSVVYLTDFPAIKSLAICATGYFTAAGNDLSNDCPDMINPTSQSSCACSKDQNSASISTLVSTGILGGYACGTAATEDVTSALVGRTPLSSDTEKCSRSTRLSELIVQLLCINILTPM
jgi:hypothetical protein